VHGGCNYATTLHVVVDAQRRRVGTTTLQRRRVGTTTLQRRRVGTTTLQPSMSRLIRNAAALSAASPTLLFSDWKNARSKVVGHVPLDVRTGD
jgi:hypothetical protein